MPWDPQQYERFKAERYAPFDDLLALIHRADNLQVVDLGCGTGELTSRLQLALPQSQVLGLDSSQEMLKRAQVHANLYLGFVNNDLQNLHGEYDLIFSHAALQWVDDHAALFSHLWSCLTPAGQLAIQMPSNHHHLTHRLIQSLAIEEPFQSALKGYQRQSPVLSIEAYASLLYQLGAEQIEVFEKIYPHILPSADELLEWVKGTALVPYLERLPADLQAEWLLRYRQRITEAFPEAPVFYPFKRILISARKPA